MLSCQYHIVFSPKYRRKVLVGEIEKRLKELIIEKQEQYDYKILDMEVMPDHIHLLLDIHPKKSVENIVNMIKVLTAKAVIYIIPIKKRIS